MSTTLDERHLTACHEAGHAVAVLMRRGEFTGITIDPTAEYAGKTWHRCTDWHEQFVIYAGPWAAARAQWPRESLGGLDDLDDGGDLFADYVAVAFLHNPDGDA